MITGTSSSSQISAKKKRRKIRNTAMKLIKMSKVIQMKKKTGPLMMMRERGEAKKKRKKGIRARIMRMRRVMR